jgi:hypothetical protein
MMAIAPTAAASTGIRASAVALFRTTGAGRARVRTKKISDSPSDNIEYVPISVPIV